MDANASNENKDIDCPTGATGAIEIVADFPQLSNPDSTPANENPGALAGATGAMSKDQAIVSKDYRNRAEAATALCHAIADCNPSDACEIMGAALDDLTLPTPIPALFGVMDEAAFWADMADRQTLKAYCLATWRRMALEDQTAFLSFVQRRAA